MSSLDTLNTQISLAKDVQFFGKRSLAVAVFIGRRLLFAALTLLVIIFLSFFGLEMARGVDFLEAIASGFWKTGGYLSRLISGDLGTAYIANYGTRRLEINQIVRETLPRSLGLMAVSLGGAALIGIVLGSIASRRQSLLSILLILLLSLAGISLPTFFAALLLQLGVIELTQLWGSTLLPVGGFGWDAHLILPALVLAARPIAQITRVTQTTLNEIWREDYVRTARGKGLRNYIIWLRHVGPNVAIPVLTTVGSSLRFSLSSLPVVELYFGWPGVGLTLLRAIARRDDLLTVALALTLGLIFIIVNLLLEGSYHLIDPKLRERASLVSRHSQGIVAALRSALIDFIATGRRWFRFGSKRTPADQGHHSPLPKVRPERKIDQDRAIRRERFRTWLRATLGNLPFVLGAVMLLGLLIVYLAGPALSPSSPYLTNGLAYIGGEIYAPPFDPSPEFPWGSDALGRDVQSLVLSGARQTLTLVGLVMLARLMVGFMLGTLAGWQQDKFLDKIIMAVSEIFAALPTLIFAMILILALGIRQGLWVFVAALCFVGWGEMMQFIRSEVIVIRHKLYIESAVALGTGLSGLIGRHILPNLLPALISLAALEMGAVAMLLGELGFIGIFIGGGAFAEVDIGGPPYHYSDVPEWGALLSNVRQYARSYPWTAIYPGLAFFLAILSFNLFGEGMRRVVQDVGLSFNRFFNRYTLAASIGLALGLGWLQNNTGLMPFYRSQAQAFDGARALTHLEVLTDPALAGRAVGTQGLDLTADYIAQHFKRYGLQPGGRRGTYFLEVKQNFYRLTEPPRLTANGQPLLYRQDFAEIPTNLFNGGPPKSGELVVLGYGDQVFDRSIFTGGQLPRQVLELNFVKDAVLVLDNRAFLPEALRQGTFYLTQEAQRIKQRDGLSIYGQGSLDPVPMRGSPFFYVSETGLDKMLADSEWSTEKLMAAQAALRPEEVAVWRTGVQVDSALVGQPQEKAPARHVIGYLPGLDETKDANLIVVLAQYDGLGADGQGDFYPSANDNASGVAVMLEMLRAWQEAGYQPKKTIVFVAYVGEGFEYGKFPSRRPDVERFIGAKFGSVTAFNQEAFVFLRGLGAGSGRGLSLAAGGNIRLAQLFERSASQLWINTQRANEDFTLDVIFGTANRGLTEDAPTITLTWSGFEETANTPADTLDTIDPNKLDQAGKVLSLGLLIMGREVNY